MVEDGVIVYRVLARSVGEVCVSFSNIVPKGSVQRSDDVIIWRPLFACLSRLDYRSLPKSSAYCVLRVQRNICAVKKDSTPRSASYQFVVLEVSLFIIVNRKYWYFVCVHDIDRTCCGSMVYANRSP